MFHYNNCRQSVELLYRQKRSNRKSIHYCNQRYILSHNILQILSVLFSMIWRSHWPCCPKLTIDLMCFWCPASFNKVIALFWLRTYPKIRQRRIWAEASLRKAIQFSGFLHHRILILRRLANHPRVLSTTHRRAGKLFSPGIGHSSYLASFLRRRCLMWGT